MVNQGKNYLSSFDLNYSKPNFLAETSLPTLDCLKTTGAIVGRQGNISCEVVSAQKNYDDCQAQVTAVLRYSSENSAVIRTSSKYV